MDVLMLLRLAAHEADYNSESMEIHRCIDRIIELRNQRPHPPLNDSAATEPTLTGEEREAMKWAARAAADPSDNSWYAPAIAATLSGLLEKLEGGR